MTLETKPLAEPVPCDTCPLCGGANACAPVVSGTFDTPCWCTDMSFPAELLAQIPESERNKTCICKRCVRSFDQPP